MVAMHTEPLWVVLVGQPGSGKTTLAGLFMHNLLASSAQASSSLAPVVAGGLVVLQQPDALQWPMLATGFSDTSVSVADAAGQWWPEDVRGLPFAQQLERVDWWLAEQVVPCGGVSALWLGDISTLPVAAQQLMVKAIGRLGSSQGWAIWDAPLPHIDVPMAFSTIVWVWAIANTAPLLDVQAYGQQCQQRPDVIRRTVQAVINGVYPPEAKDARHGRDTVAWLQTEADGVRLCGQLPHVPLGQPVLESLEEPFAHVQLRMNLPADWLGSSAYG